jgi:dolichyl-phosphate beta-glucosyltransferase
MEQGEKAAGRWDDIVNLPGSSNDLRAREISAALIGLAITVSAWLFIPEWIGLPAPGLAAAFAWMALGIAAGFCFRVVRRRMLPPGVLSVHKAFSFEALFQGAILLNPRLEYPGVEREFLMHETGVADEEFEPWFRVRQVSAVSIPLFLSGIVCALASFVTAAVFCFAAAAVFVSIVSLRVKGASFFRFFLAVALGLAAAGVEGWGFTLAVRSGGWAGVSWQAFLLYAVILTAFELSPVPLTLGILEFAYGPAALVVGAGLPGLIVPMMYRLLRGVPILLLTFLYLPRYKLAYRDIFDGRLPLALALTRRPQGGWPIDKAAKGPLLSIVIPAFNEERRLPIYLPDVLAFAEGSEHETEVLVVDDGSSDGTAAYVEKTAAEHKVLRLLRQGKNQGKGAAVRRGMMEAAGRYVLFADADGATPIREVAKMLPVAERGIEVVIASRKAGGEVARSLIRSLMGATFYRLTNLLAVPAVADTQCGFKLFNRAAAERIFPLVQEKGWAFDVEVLFLAQKFGLAISEVPVEWTAIEGSKVNPIQDGLKMFMALWRIRNRASGFVPERSRESRG